MKGLIILFVLSGFFLHFCGGRWENLTRTAGGRCAFLFPFFFFKNEISYTHSLKTLHLLFSLLMSFGGDLFALFCFLVGIF